MSRAPRGSGRGTSGAARETQPERTALSWQRTGLGVLGVAALLAHSAVAGDAPARLAAAGAVALLGLGVLGWLAPLRARAVHRAVGRGGGVAAPRLALLAAALVAAVAGATLVAVLSR
ncbi:hypothetical protein DQ238_20170 [Geodermatophilus sp. TF02-6]|uniref:DUF202 domain-containing protein n=1 Tax=Geodermatophilus sp. TF02-6 TaxID=2250575 RepID=UPI000DEBFE03|nr:DUF202 domain-containing protein [Geodermatophilus sp. TF02-6]RBY75250.1 hypothetical protein DQ238_20170 [Geodermatophilus sp. TF02-6]